MFFLCIFWSKESLIRRTFLQYFFDIFLVFLGVVRSLTHAKFELKYNFLQNLSKTSRKSLILGLGPPSWVALGAPRDALEWPRGT